MSQKPEILKRKIIAQSRIFTIEGLELRFANGALRHYERLVGDASKNSVMIVPMLDQETVLLIREYAAGINEYTLGLPKGVVDEGESSEQAANRELQEEVGYAARHIEYLTTLTVSPGYLIAQMDVLVARNLYEKRLVGDEPEIIEVVPWSINHLDELLERPDFREARSIAALFMVKQRLTKDE